MRAYGRIDAAPPPRSTRTVDDVVKKLKALATRATELKLVL